MSFDEKLFREKAKEANFNDGEINEALKEYYANNKPLPTPAVETVKGMVDLFTDKNPSLGISPADVLLYAGGAGAAFAAGKKGIDLIGEGMSAAGSAIKNKITGTGGSAVPPTNPTASTQAQMAIPEIEKPPAPTNLTLQDAAERLAQLPKTPVEQAKIDLQTLPDAPAPAPVAKELGRPTIFSQWGEGPSPAPAAGLMDRPNPYMDVPGEITKVPEIKGQAGAAQPPKVKNVLAFSDVPKPVIPPSGAERRTGLTKEIAIEEGKLNAAQRQLAAKLGAEKLPATEWYSFQDEVYGKKPPKSDPKGGGVPEWDNIVKTAKNNPTKYPEIVAAIDKIEKKYPKQSGQANIGMLLGLAGNLVGGIGIAKALKEGDTATAGLGAIDQFLANASMFAGKKGALGALGTIASRLSPFMIGMTPSTVGSGTLDSPEFREMMTRAKPIGAVPPPR